jgi:hypothetical protein
MVEGKLSIYELSRIAEYESCLFQPSFVAFPMKTASDTPQARKHLFTAYNM